MKIGDKSPSLSRDVTAATPTPGVLATAASAPVIQPGSTLDHFEILGLLGAGGFGQVYRARDTRLERLVAVKVLPDVFARDAERRERLRREAIAASALNHPNICTVYDLVEAGGHYLIVMELVEGKTLHALLADGPLPVAQALPIAIQIADALAEAHKAGILHRDIKSSNIAINARGQVKVLDFGLAKLLGSARTERESPTLERLTAEGTTLGTLSYMSPEQLLAQPVDQRSDLFSVGVVLYEMLTRRLPFEGSSPIAVADAVLHAEPRPFGEAVLAGLKAIVARLLQKDPEKRPASAEALREELRAFETSLSPTRSRLSPPALAGLAVAALVVLTAGGWLWYRASRARWALETAAPEVARLIETEDFLKAVDLLRQARAILPEDPSLEKLWRKATDEASAVSTPAGAEVSIHLFDADQADWLPIGQTPFKGVRIPNGIYSWRFTKPGFATVTFLDAVPTENSVTLLPAASVPVDVVPVLAGPTSLPAPYNTMQPVKLERYLVDRCEVTNEEFKRFVDAGGYGKRELWKQPFVDAGQLVAWEKGIERFRDATGRPGPATWELGTFPKGREKHPVAGVSWYEAAAYAEFAGKSLPSAYHWWRASEPYGANLIVKGSNFHGSGTRPVGSPGSLSGFGTSDMAGNVKEWCWNETAGGKRFLLGGGWDESDKMFVMSDARSAWDRTPNEGFRCVKLTAPPVEAALAKLEREAVDYTKEKPVSDEVFAALRSLFAYDEIALDGRVEETEKAEDWTKEKVSFNGAAAGERLQALLFLPKSAKPPYQTVVLFPGSNALFIQKLEAAFLVDMGWDFLPKSGRAVLIPIYKGTFERRDGLKTGATASNPPTVWRDHSIAWVKEVGRSLDYVRSRKDLDGARPAYFGYSLGAALSPVLLATNRFETAVLLSGGLWAKRGLPECDPFNFLPRVKTPALLIGGSFDFSFPLDASQVPFFQALGTAGKDKRHAVFETGHFPPVIVVIKETLDWLDKYLGPVKP